jgi:hypothetical protein
MVNYPVKKLNVACCIFGKKRNYMRLKAVSGNYDLPVGTHLNLYLYLKSEKDVLLGVAKIVGNKNIYTLEIEDEDFSYIRARRISLKDLYCSVGQDSTNGVIQRLRAVIFDEEKNSMGGRSIGEQLSGI